MTQLLLGLLIVLLVHSVRIVAEDWRARMVARLGLPLWAGIFSLVSVLGFTLLVWGFVLVREQPLVLWLPPAFLRTPAIALMALSFILLAAAAVPRNHLKAWLHHPEILAVKVWALAHLLVNGMLLHLILFGSFLAWSVLAYRAARRRDQRAAAARPRARTAATLLTLLAGLAGWWAMAHWLHGWLIGIRPVPWL